MPVRRNDDRRRIRRYLQRRGFGCLQQSVWITPDPVKPELEMLSGGVVRVSSLTLFEACPCGGESDLEIVNGAWDFASINRRYHRLLSILANRPTFALMDERTVRTFGHWAAAERKAWLDAVSHDPLLPRPILPPGYQGRIAWSRRQQVLQEAAAQLRTSRTTAH